MAKEKEFASAERLAAEGGIASDESAVSEPEIEANEGPVGNTMKEPDESAITKDDSGARCLVELGRSGLRCGRNLHMAPDRADERPVCLMHSKDPRKQSGPLFEEFRLEIERTLAEAQEGEAHFEYFVFPLLILKRRKINATCLFVSATFTKGADLRDTTFAKNANFYEATFHERVDFSGATFTMDEDFPKTIFWGDAIFSGTKFMKGANFSEATFAGIADFSWATFQQDAGFRETTFKQKADFWRATFTHAARFWDTKFHRTVYWRGSQFLDRAEFRHTRFEPQDKNIPSAVFALAKFSKPGDIVFDSVDLSRALFHNCDVSQVWFTSSVWWAKREGHHGLAVFEEEILLKPEFAQLRKDYGYFDHGAVEQIYHQLQKNYDTRLDYRKANDFHYGQMEMRRLEATTGGLFSIQPRFLRRWASLLNLYRVASDYGNSYAKPGAWLFAVLLAATFMFPIAGLELKRAISASTASVTYGSEWDKNNSWMNNFWTEAKLIGKSGITAIDTATFQRTPEYTPVYPRGRVVAIVETLLTSSLFALFLLAIRRQFRR
jgi:uncharacterized protein YjbI with pentapeptide repeats